MLLIAPLAALALCLAVIARKVKTHVDLRSFGGHWSAGWSRLWLLRIQNSGRMHEHFTAINNRYGSTARIAPRMLITVDPGLFRRMNAVRSPYTRGPWYTALKLHPERDNITSYTNEDEHAHLRNRMAAGYSGRDNIHLEQDIDEKLERFLALLDTKYASRPEQNIHRKADLSRLTSFFTLDVISQVAFGESFGFLDGDADPFGYLANLETFLPAIILFGVYTELTNILKIPLIKAALPKATDQRGLGRVMGFAKERVHERFGEKPTIRRDMVHSFIEHGLSQEELESETLTQITAGSDSTASSLRMILHFVCTSPPVLARLVTEFRTAVDAGRVSRPVIRNSEACQLPYLQACIHEGLRMYPPVTGLLAKQVPAGGTCVEVDGRDKFVPGGTQIGWNSWGMMRDNATFGEDCDIFRPERWLPRDQGSAELDRVATMMNTVSLCFGYGRFGCLGRGVAMMELNKAVIETLIRFNLQPCRLSNPFRESCVGFWIHKDMDFVVTRREDHMSLLGASMIDHGEAICNDEDI